MMTADILDGLFATIAARKDADANQSYTASLLASAPEKPARKLSEETTEVVIEAIRGDAEAVARESADLLYHLLVVWAAAGVKPEEVWQILANREGLSGLAEKASRSQNSDQ